MITIFYYYSACVGIVTPDASILTDPWFTDGIYDGSWYHYPQFPDPLDRIPPYDYVYVSHIHPDHYDPNFLRQYLAKHPTCQVLIGPHVGSFLSRRMQSDNIEHLVIEEVAIDATRLRIIHNGGDPTNIDSALAVSWDGHSVLHMNDNDFSQDQINQCLAFCGQPNIALLGYTGAGPYPQTYHTDPKILTEKARQKKEDFFERYKRMRNALDPQVTIPFAGQYLLGGKLHKLNPYRGAADAIEVKQFDPSAVVLADGGQASIDTATLVPTAERTQPYDREAMALYAASLADRPMAYEAYFADLPIETLPIRQLLPKAYEGAAKRTVCEEDYFLCIRLSSDWFVANARRGANEFQFTDEVEHLVPRSEIFIDLRYLFGLITRLFHWNNAEIGSQYMCRRVPDYHNRQFQHFLNFFQV
jgi:UDP-MurNAc hydroxylase